MTILSVQMDPCIKLRATASVRHSKWTEYRGGVRRMRLRHLGAMLMTRVTLYTISVQSKSVPNEDVVSIESSHDALK